jgi:predicted DCC family thiol-disulfide oxidoreductase YuxK
MRLKRICPEREKPSKWEIMNVPQNRLNQVLLFDGDCPMCQGAVLWLEKAGLLKVIEARSWQSEGLLDPDLTERIRVELLLWDRDSSQVKGGFSALMALMRVTPAYRWLAGLLGLPPLLWLGEHAYKTVSLNRRILSPPNTGGMACACDPPFHLGYRVTLYGACLLLNLLGCTGLLLILLASQEPVSTGMSGFTGSLSALVRAMLVLNAPIGVLWLGGLLTIPRRWRALFQQTLVLMGESGILLLVLDGLWLLLKRFQMADGLNNALFGVLSLAFIGLLFWDLRKRLKALGLPMGLAILWQLSAAGLWFAMTINA